MQLFGKVNPQFGSIIDASSKHKVQWIEQKGMPIYRFSNPVQLNVREFVITPTAIRDCHLYIYNVFEDSFRKWHSTPTQLQGSELISFVALHENIIYFFTVNGNILMFEVHRQQWNEQTINCPIGFGAVHLIKDDQIHIFGGEYNSYHLIWKPGAASYERIHYMKLLPNPGLVFIQNQNRFLLLGGCSCNTDEHNYNEGRDVILSFDALNNSWTQAGVSLPVFMHTFGCVLTIDQKYILFFGGSNNFYDHTDDIYVMNTTTMKIHKSFLKCPVAANFGAYVSVDSTSDHLLVSGFIRYCWNVQEFESVRILSDDIIKLIQSFHVQQMVYILDKNKGSQWKINVQQITDESNILSWNMPFQISQRGLII